MGKRPASAPTRVIAERYRLVSEMARGGMGAVWEAEDLKLGRKVAVKIMGRDLIEREQATARFEREATTAAQLDSAHVVQIFDYGMDDVGPFIVMELLNGENLSRRLRKRKRLDVPEATLILTQICKGLRAAHEASLIHRDLKPSNIFLATRDDGEIAKILDFGVVKALTPMATDEVTRTGALLGTPQYMSPEQARAKKDIDHRSDLWSVAVIAFRMLGGINPFGGESVADVILKLVSDDIPRITDYRPELPQTADVFFARAFARDPADRYPTAPDLARAFHTLVPHRSAVPDPRLALGSLAHQAPPPIASPMPGNPVLGNLIPSSHPTPPLGSGFGGEPSTPDPRAHAAATSSLPPGQHHLSEPTPHSTTVAGTPIPVAAMRSPPRVAIVVGGVTVALFLTMCLSAILIESPTRESVVETGTTQPSDDVRPAATPSPEPDDVVPASEPSTQPSASASGQPSAKPPAPTSRQPPAPLPRPPVVQPPSSPRPKPPSIFE